ncbi:unnamed protein product [Symbiodinium sp. CCMP2592]|nr:unnamed protein product [Symbiodinium sp. CCMP2592]
MQQWQCVQSLRMQSCSFSGMQSVRRIRRDLLWTARREHVEPAGKHDPFRAVVLSICGAFVAGFFARGRRTLVARRCAVRKVLALKDSKAEPRPESMYDALRRLNDHAAALGGNCLAVEYQNNCTKVPWRCRHGHTWDALPKNVLNSKTWCPECARNRQRIPAQRLQEHAKARGGRCLLTSEHNRSRAKVLWQCKLGHTWEATPDRVLNRGTWCPKCSRKGRTRKKRSLKDLQQHAASLAGSCLAQAYEGWKTPVAWQCHKGHTWSASPSSILCQETWCPFCAGKARLDLHQLQEHAARRGGECLATEYVNNKSKVTWKCEHGHTWQASSDDVLNRGHWCPHCRKIGLLRVRDHAASLGGRCLARSYKNSSEKLLWECKEGHRWPATTKAVLYGKTWCPQCAARTWHTEAEVRRILETIFFPATFPSRYPSFLQGLQLDGYCPNFKLGFEYQGEQHYDPENYFHFGDLSSFHAQQERDRRKAILCRKSGVRLLVVPCFVNDKRTFVLTALLHWFSWAQIAPTELPRC